MRYFLSLIPAVALVFAVSNPSSPSTLVTTKPVTYSEQIASIIYNKCTPCHRTGEAAPFTLTNYTEIKKRGRVIAAVTKARTMPPWKADQGDYEFKNERRLSDAEIDLIQRWVADGMAEGNPAAAPLMPKFIEGWQLGKPDLIVKMREAYTVPADGPDIYRNFAIPLNLAEDKWVKAVDFRPGTRAVVHHSLFFLDTTGDARKKDAADPEPGYSGGMGGGVNVLALLGARGRNDGKAVSLSLGGWAVGAQARQLPDGLAFFVPKGSDLILSTHFHPSGKVEKESSTLGLYFSDKAPDQAFAGIQLPPLFGVFKGINIPAGAKDYTIEDSFVIPVDIRAFGVGAHAHYLAKTMKLTATLPDGSSKKLLSISDWDFAWQDQYQFKQFVSLPKGTRLDVRITYDNSAENPHNPSSPPKRVHWGEGSFDEMGSMSLQVVTSKPEEMSLLRQEVMAHVRKAVGGRSNLFQLPESTRPNDK